VGAVFLDKNGAWAAPSGEGKGGGESVQGPIIVTPSNAGQGFAEAVHALVAHRQAPA